MRAAMKKIAPKMLTRAIVFALGRKICGIACESRSKTHSFVNAFTLRVKLGHVRSGY